MGFTLTGDIEQPTPAIETKRPCGRCGYELRGLPETHACPECGLPFDAYSSYIPLGAGNQDRSTIVVAAVMVVTAAGMIAAMFNAWGWMLPVLAALMIVAFLVAIRPKPTGECYLLINRAGISLLDSQRGTITFPWSRIETAKYSFWRGSCRLQDADGRTLLLLRANDTGSDRNSWRIAWRIDELAKIYKDESTETE